MDTFPSSHFNAWPGKVQKHLEKLQMNWTIYMYIMLLQATIIRNYFVKTQTYVASFGPPDLSIIFSTGMYLEVSPL